MICADTILRYMQDCCIAWRRRILIYTPLKRCVTPVRLQQNKSSPINTADADATKLFCRVASASAVCTWIRDDCRRIRRCERTTQPSAVTEFTILQPMGHDCRRVCSHRRVDDTTKLSPTSCEFVYTPPTRRDSTVSSRRRRRCVLDLRSRIDTSR